MAKFLDKTGLERLTEHWNGRLDAKQDKLTGQPGQVVGFGEDGEAVAQDAPEASGGIGQSMAGQTVEPTQGETVTAEEGAEIFNDYRERQFGTDSEDSEAVMAQQGNVASGARSHAEGCATTASGINSHAEGYCGIASGSASHVEGGRFTGKDGNKASGYAAHAEGASTTASGAQSHAEGASTTASGLDSHAEGKETIAEGSYSHAEGGETKTTAGWSHAEGYSTTASGQCSHAEGSKTTASGSYSHAEGYNTTAEGAQSHAEGAETQTTANCTHAEGWKTIASKDQAHAEGTSTEASGRESHAEGSSTTASGAQSHAEGYNTIASGAQTHAGGFCTIAAYRAQTSIGRYNKSYTDPDSIANTAGDLFVIGKGSSETARANIFRVDLTAVYGTGTYKTSGADYAELFQWLDGNPDAEDRVGRFVTLDGDKIRLAGPEDDFILGIVSGSPSVVGDVHDDQWQGMFLHDIYGRPLWEDVEVPEETDDEGNVIINAQVEHRQKINPDYDHTQRYIPRSERPEWDAVGMLGKLVARDDGTCQVNGWCMPGDGGIATASMERTRYRIMERLDESHVRVLVV